MEIQSAHKSFFLTNLMIAQYVVNAYQTLISAAKNNDPNQLPMDIPKLKAEDLKNLLNVAQNFFQSEPILFRLNVNCIIVGDLHGNLRDLLRIFAFNGLPPERKYIFLGDYVDRGEFSIEVITLLFSLKILFPNDIYLIRGNHEFMEINSVYGFKDQVLAEYDAYMYKVFNDCFAYIPLACVLNETFFLVHGGLSPSLSHVEELDVVQRPIYTLNEQMLQKSFIADLLWSDPGDSNVMYVKNYRGYGYLFGPMAALSFLRTNNLKRIIRSHQCVNAIQKAHGNTVITVFSTSNYSKKAKNTSGILEITGQDVNTYIYDAQDQFKKSDASYRIIEAVERSPLCFCNKFNSVIQPKARKRRATVDEMQKSENRKSITPQSSLPRLICTPTKGERLSMNYSSGIQSILLNSM